MRTPFMMMMIKITIIVRFSNEIDWCCLLLLESTKNPMALFDSLTTTFFSILTKNLVLLMHNESLYAIYARYYCMRFGVSQIGIPS
jgi:hypothetical protein